MRVTLQASVAGHMHKHKHKLSRLFCRRHSQRLSSSHATQFRNRLLTGIPTLSISYKTIITIIIIIIVNLIVVVSFLLFLSLPRDGEPGVHTRRRLQCSTDCVAKLLSLSGYVKATPTIAS